MLICLPGTINKQPSALFIGDCKSMSCFIDTFLLGTVVQVLCFLWKETAASDYQMGAAHHAGCPMGDSLSEGTCVSGMKYIWLKARTGVQKKIESSSGLTGTFGGEGWVEFTSERLLRDYYYPTCLVYCRPSHPSRHSWSSSFPLPPPPAYFSPFPLKSSREFMPLYFSSRVTSLMSLALSSTAILMSKHGKGMSDCCKFLH